MAVISKKIRRVFAMEWSKMAQYRADLVLWTLATAAAPLVSLAIWYTVAASSSGGLSTQDTLTYYLLILVVTTVTGAWAGFFLAKEILDGEIAKYLARPLSVFWLHIANNIVEKSIRLVIPLPVLVTILILFRESFSPSLYQPLTLFFFFVSLMLSAVLSFTWEITFGVLAFWFEDILEVRRFQDLLYQTASGIIIPFGFLPDTVQTVLGLLPYRYMVATPAEIAIGQVTGTDIYVTMLYQIGWITASIVILTILWKQGLKRYAVPGQ